MILTLESLIMPIYPNELVSPTSLVLLQPLLEALEASETAFLKPISSLPAPCFRWPEAHIVVCATPITALPIYRATMVTVAAMHQVDVVCVRHGFYPETLDDVTIDVVTGRNRSVKMLWGMARYRAADGSTWLVPPIHGEGHSIRIDRTGLMPCAEPPYSDLHQRGDGLGRAARETVRAIRALRRV